MKFHRRRFLHLAAGAGAAALPAVSRSASAQTYPARPTTIIVPFPAGGPIDVLPRISSERMSVSLGQSVVIENVAGAGGSSDPAAGTIAAAHRRPRAPSSAVPICSPPKRSIRPFRDGDHRMADCIVGVRTTRLSGTTKEVRLPAGRTC
jgi:hypothetical protein